MPGGIQDPWVGFAAFTAVKWIGYTGAAAALRRAYPDARVSLLASGAVRTGIGLAFGSPFGLLAVVTAEQAHTGAGLPAFYIRLAGVRLLEWWILRWLFYDRPLREKARGWKCAVGGTVWSYVLDVPALFGLVTTGGLWVC